jgi:hypothetical protein
MYDSDARDAYQGQTDHRHDDPSIETQTDRRANQDAYNDDGNHTLR